MKVEEDEMRGESYYRNEDHREAICQHFIPHDEFSVSVSLEDSACNTWGTFIFAVWAHFPDAGWFLLWGLICMMNESLCL